jgi:hypothetical protein
MVLGLLLMAVAHLISACDGAKKQNPYVLKEAIDVEGMCWENHVGQRDRYAGQIVRWQTVKTGEILTYGFLIIPFSVERTLDEVAHPTLYHPPSVISIMKIDIDTNQPNWVIHGVSNRDENSQGYDSTCEVDVMKRGMEINMFKAPKAH